MRHLDTTSTAPTVRHQGQRGAGRPRAPRLSRRDLLAEFRALAPHQRPVVLQRWSLRRVSGAAAMLAIVVAVTYVGYTLVTPVRNLGAQAPECGTGHAMILAAQAVPSAALLPCIAALPDRKR